MAAAAGEAGWGGVYIHDDSRSEGVVRNSSIAAALLPLSLKSSGQRGMGSGRSRASGCCVPPRYQSPNNPSSIRKSPDRCAGAQAVQVGAATAAAATAAAAHCPSRRLTERVGEAGQVAGERAEAAEAERRLQPARVADLYKNRHTPMTRE